MSDPKFHGSLVLTRTEPGCHGHVELRKFHPLFFQPCFIGVVGRVGRLVVGARGDVAIWDVSGVESAGSWDPAALLLAGPGRVRDLFVEGAQVVRDGVVVTLDLPVVLEQARRLAKGLAAG